MLLKKLTDFMNTREFVYIASCDGQNHPFVAPKFLLKVQGHFIFLIDYVMSRTLTNLKNNPFASLSTINMDSLTGFQANGRAEVLSAGPEYESLKSEFKEKEVRLSVNRVLEGLKRKKGHEHFEVMFPDTCVIFKFRIEEIVEISPAGQLKRENI